MYARFARYQVHHGYPIVRIFRGGDHVVWLVQQVVHQIGSHAHRVAIHRNDVDVDVHASPQHRDFAVDRDATLRDDLLAHTSAAEPALCQYLLQPFARVVVGRIHVAVSGTTRKPASSASTTPASGTKSLIGGMSSNEFRPKRSRKSGVVPYITARPGPSSRAISVM